MCVLVAVAMPPGPDAYGPLSTASPQQTAGTLCVAPAVMDPDRGPMVNDCASRNFSFRIDDGPKTPWSKTSSVHIERLDLTTKHRVTVYCGGKRHQSFVFRFTDYKSRELCLFLNDLYQTVQLWDHGPWCKCAPRHKT
jgi:hypothetical protein